MQTLYTAEAIEELLSQKNADGIAINRWADDGSEIIPKTQQELATELKAKLLSLKNEFDIFLYKDVNGVAVAKTQGELNQEKKDVYDKKENRVKRFNIEKAIGDCYQALKGLLSDKTKRAAWGPFSDMIKIKSFQGVKEYGLLLISEGTITQTEFDLINGILKQQDIDLNEF